ncbi:winged helix-turn-helix transcriptional regulator [Actinoplanes sp. NPDC049681]|uniref:winged helix-turn-helix transcriptional regulator n=1 Tax=Actinoplanes sp. NPDC049681 TaxID=3363905 RepID=UPI00379BAE7A
MAAGYGQFCAVARALEVLGERWTLLVVRELLLGAGRFSELQRGLPRISRTVLTQRLRELERAGLVLRAAGAAGPTYALTPAGEALAPVLRELGGWAYAWDRRGLGPDHLDPETLVWDMRRRLHPERLPASLTVVQLTFRGRADKPYYLHARRPDVTLCTDSGGHPVALQVEADLEALTRFWLGERQWGQLLRAESVRLTGPAPLRRVFPTWFSGYALRP